MSFDYKSVPVVSSISPPSKNLRCKSFLINIATGSGFTTATSYTVGYLAAGHQVVGGLLSTAIAVSGGTVSAATLTVAVGGNNLFVTTSVFATGNTTPNSTGLLALGDTPTTSDVAITYTPTLTGSGATAGKMYLHIYYVE